MSLKERGEFGFIAGISPRAGTSSQLLLGIGDDAASLAPTPGLATLVTTDMLLEGIHFDLSFTDPYTLGQKALAVNLSDLAAMGAYPRFYFLSLGVPGGTDGRFLDDLVDGITAMGSTHGAVLAGGDTCGSRGGLVVSITAMGEQRPELVVTRSGARAGDTVWVTGTIGDSAAGLKLLQQGVRDGFCVGRHLLPTPRVAAGIALAEAGIPTAMLDISDGLLGDLGHILEQSGCGCEIFLDRLPLSEPLCLIAATDPWLLPLSGGEDYELVFTVSPEKAAAVASIAADVGVAMTSIGTITAEPGARVILPDGGYYAALRAGYDHFAGS